MQASEVWFVREHGSNRLVMTASWKISHGLVGATNEKVRLYDEETNRLASAAFVRGEDCDDLRDRRTAGRPLSLYASNVLGEDCDERTTTAPMPEVRRRSRNVAPAEIEAEAWGNRRLLQVSQVRLRVGQASEAPETSSRRVLHGRRLEHDGAHGPAVRF